MTFWQKWGCYWQGLGIAETHWLSLLSLLALLAGHHGTNFFMAKGAGKKTAEGLTARQ